jgi:predicted nucleic acid-binding protein
VIHLDSSFLVDLLRETSRNRPDRAVRFIDTLDAAEVLGMSVFVLCELVAGAELSRKPSQEIEAIDRVSSGLQIAYPDDRFAPAYGKLLASLRRSGQQIGTMDLLIATAAVLEDARLVTRNVKEFSRVPSLDILAY